MALTQEEKRKLLVLLLLKATLNWLWEGWHKPKTEDVFYGYLYIDFYHLPEANGHHGTCAVVIKEDTKPEKYKLWGPFGYADNVYVMFKGRKIFLYQMDWGVAKEEHFQDSPALAELAQKISDKEKIFLFGVRTLEGKLWWLYRKPQNFMLIPR